MYIGTTQLGFPMDEVLLMRMGLLLDLWECHRQIAGNAKPKIEYTLDDIIPY